jgi:endonuclease/exonuclease/phosphatase family metal-dependent hydrolase
MSIYYGGLRATASTAATKRTIERLLALREQLAPIRLKRNPRTLLLATWNVRDLGANGFNPRDREEEAYYYIAETIATFDLVAVQEVNRNLAPFQKVMKLLGPRWDYIVTDATEGRGGNDERMAFVFNSGVVRFRKIAGEIVLPGGQTIIPAGAAAGASAATAGVQFARTPFLVSLQAGWFRFNLCTVHIYYGEDTGPKLEQRRQEIERIARFFKARQEKENEDYILLGDFNIVSPQHETMQALESNGFVVPEPLKFGAGVAERGHFYDQIALRVREKRLEIGEGGVIDLYRSVFREEDLPAYLPLMQQDSAAEAANPAKYFRKWRTWQISDHMPMWIELRTDFSDAYLKSLRQP